MSYLIEHVSIRCRNLETSIDYFRKMFNAEVILRREPDKSKRIVFLRIGDSMLYETGFYKTALKKGIPSLIFLIDPKGFTQQFVYFEKDLILSPVSLY